MSLTVILRYSSSNISRKISSPFQKTGIQTYHESLSLRSLVCLFNYVLGVCVQVLAAGLQGPVCGEARAAPFQPPLTAPLQDTAEPFSSTDGTSGKTRLRKGDRFLCSPRRGPWWSSYPQCSIGAGGYALKELQSVEDPQ